jgi:hypothetical protein
MKKLIVAAIRLETAKFKAVMRIRIHMFLGLPDPDPDPLVRGMDPDPSISFSKNSKKNLDFYCFVINMQKNFF